MDKALEMSQLNEVSELERLEAELQEKSITLVLSEMVEGPIAGIIRTLVLLSEISKKPNAQHCKLDIVGFEIMCDWLEKNYEVLINSGEIFFLDVLSWLVMFTDSAGICVTDANEKALQVICALLRKHPKVGSKIGSELFKILDNVAIFNVDNWPLFLSVWKQSANKVWIPALKSWFENQGKKDFLRTLREQYEAEVGKPEEGCTAPRLNKI